ncbi:MAG: DJ-1 family glyoxalase III [Lachnospiraceae bacterium]
MSKVYVFLADGFEEIEALTTVDILRRAGVEVVTVSIKPEKQVTGGTKIEVTADAVFAESDFADADMLVLPGGGLGTENLENYAPLIQLVKEFYGQGRRISAICTAPRILGDLGMLEGKRATAYPAMMGRLQGAVATENSVEQDGTILTSRGVGTAIDFALAIVEELISKAKAQEISESIVYSKS